MSEHSDQLKEVISKLFDSSNDSPSAVLELLDLEERKRLLKRLDAAGNLRDIDYSDLDIKIDTVITLLAILNNSQKMRQSLEADADNKLLLDLHNLAYELCKTAYEERSEDTPPQQSMSYLVLLAMNGFLADKHSEVSPYIAKSLPARDERLEENEPRLESLYLELNLTVLFLVKAVRTQKDKQNLVDQLTNCRRVFDTLQNSSLNEMNDDFSVSYKVGALGNVIYTLDIVFDYLFNGETSNGENVYSSIDGYCFNAIALFSKAGSTKDENFTQLLRQFLAQICRNSVWNIAGRSPILADFFKNGMGAKEHILYTLLPSQRDSILDLLTVKKSVIINMPTSAGKSLLAELYILFTLHSNADPDNPPMVCYIVPTNALINQVKNKLTKSFDGLGYTIDSVLPFFEVDPIEDEILNRKPINILVSTPEKLDSLIRKDHASIKNLKLVVMDEAHNIIDDERGAKMELLLSIIKRKKPDARFLLMSPFIENDKRLALWLGDTEQDSLALSSEWTPTKQFIGCTLISPNKKKLSVKYFPSGRNDLIGEDFEVDIFNSSQSLRQAYNVGNTPASLLAVIEKYLRMGNMLILCKGPGTAEGLAKQANTFFKDGDFQTINDVRIDDVIALVRLELGEDALLVDSLRFGIAYHHSQLPSTVKEELEALIKEGLIRLVFATTTLAQGLNFPITTVLFADLKVGGGSNTKDIENQLFWNIAGRAGRAYMDTEGHILLAKKTSEPNAAIESKTRTYIRKDLRNISSSLKSFFETYNPETPLDYQFVKNNAAISNFLQYLNHLIRISHNYDFDSIDLMKIRAMLSSSLVFNEIQIEEGFLEAQQRITGFARSYINHIQHKDTSQLKIADLFGISDISLSTFFGLVAGLKEQALAKYGPDGLEMTTKASKIILESKDEDNLSKIVYILSRIPELKVFIDGRGELKPESIARIILGWVNGKSVPQIASEVQHDGISTQKVLGMCHKYINGRLKTFVPWGMSIYQNITGDEADDNAKNLPSYIYFGVNDADSVVLASAGVPRFAIKGVKAAYTSQFPGASLAPKDLDTIRSNLKLLNYSRARVDGLDDQTIRRLINRSL